MADPCTECGMPCEPGEYHPYAACLMFKACHSSDVVRANLAFVRDTPPAPPAVEPAAKSSEERLPEGWVPLRLEWEPGYPEDVAFGPQMMMDRLKKWLDKHFARIVADRNAEDGWAAPDYRKAWQGELTNAELEQWWRLKLPHADATNRDISVFALGVEVGAGFGAAPKPPAPTLSASAGAQSTTTGE